MTDRTPSIDFQDGAAYYDYESDRGVFYQRGDGSNYQRVYSYDFNSDTWFEQSEQPSNLVLRYAGFDKKLAIFEDQHKTQYVISGNKYNFFALKSNVTKNKIHKYLFSDHPFIKLFKNNIFFGLI